MKMGTKFSYRNDNTTLYGLKICKWNIYDNNCTDNKGWNVIILLQGFYILPWSETILTLSIL